MYEAANQIARADLKQLMIMIGCIVTAAKHSHTPLTCFVLKQFKRLNCFVANSFSSEAVKKSFNECLKMATPPGKTIASCVYT